MLFQEKLPLTLGVSTNFNFFIRLLKLLETGSSLHRPPSFFSHRDRMRFKSPPKPIIEMGNTFYETKFDLKIVASLLALGVHILLLKKLGLLWPNIIIIHLLCVGLQPVFKDNLLGIPQDIQPARTTLCIYCHELTTLPTKIKIFVNLSPAS